MKWTLVLMLVTGNAEVQRFETEAACIEEGRWRTAKSSSSHPWACLKEGEELRPPERFIFDWEAIERDIRSAAGSSRK